jgi:hypothetical protein
MLPGGWYMVVMDKIVGYHILANLPSNKHLPHLLFDGIRAQLKTLHACINIMVDL